MHIFVRKHVKYLFPQQSDIGMYSKNGGGKKEPIWREHMGERRMAGNKE